MKKTHKIVMLPTDESRLLLYPSKDLIYYDKPCKKLGEKNSIPQHLYILSDDEIKEGDWYYNGINVEKALRVESQLPFHGCKKIIATNDDNLEPLPELPQSLIEYYAKHQPEEVKLDYDSDGAVIYGCGVEIWEKLKLKNNEVVVVEPKITTKRFNPQTISQEELKQNRIDAYEPAIKTYSIEEVEKLRDLASAIIGPACDILPDTYKEEIDEYYKWLKENL